MNVVWLQILDAMNQDSGIPLTQLQVDGGMTSNRLLMQLQADILCIPVGEICLLLLISAPLLKWSELSHVKNDRHSEKDQSGHKNMETFNFAALCWCVVEHTSGFVTEPITEPSNDSFKPLINRYLSVWLVLEVNVGCSILQ